MTEKKDFLIGKSWLRVGHVHPLDTFFNLEQVDSFLQGSATRRALRTKHTKLFLCGFAPGLLLGEVTLYGRPPV